MSLVLPLPSQHRRAGPPSRRAGNSARAPSGTLQCWGASLVRLAASALLTGAAMLVSVHAMAPSRVGDTGRPNFIIINMDDLGYGDIGPFGSTLHRTPHLDRMASEGRLLTSFYAMPMCTPARAALLSGAHAKRVLPTHGVVWPGSETGLSPEIETLPALLKEAGYTTAKFGKWHLGDQPGYLPRDHGFDLYYGIPYSNDMGPDEDGARTNLGEPLSAARAVNRVLPPIPLLENETVVGRMRAKEQQEFQGEITRRTLRFIEANRDRPFFVYLNPIAVHFPLYPSTEFAGRSGNGLYSDWVEEMDASVGEILGTLRSLGLDGRTFVLFTSDNGATPEGSNAPLRGRKHTPFEGGVRVPTIAWWPGHIPAGTATDEVTSVMDLLPTLTRLAAGRLPRDRKLDGADIWPLLAGLPGAKTPHHVYHYFYRLDLAAIREGPWKLFLANGELYNLETDIGESKDVAAGNPAIVSRLRALAAEMDADLGIAGMGPGCRPLDTVPDPRPLIALDGTIRPDFAPR